MKKKALNLMAIIAFCNVTSCNKEMDEHLNQWMSDNIIAFNAIRANPEYKELVSPGNEGSIYYKVLQAGNGSLIIPGYSTLVFEIEVVGVWGIDDL